MVEKEIWSEIGLLSIREASTGLRIVFDAYIEEEDLERLKNLGSRTIQQPEAAPGAGMQPSGKDTVPDEPEGCWSSTDWENRKIWEDEEYGIGSYDSEWDYLTGEEESDAIDSSFWGLESSPGEAGRNNAGETSEAHCGIHAVQELVWDVGALQSMGPEETCRRLAPFITDGQFLDQVKKCGYACLEDLLEYGSPEAKKAAANKAVMAAREIYGH